MIRQQANRHGGTTLRTNYVRLSKQLPAHLAGTDYVQLAYDLKAEAIWIRPVKGESNLTGNRLSKIDKGKGKHRHIYCSLLSQVMPRGQYTFLKKLLTGVIFVYEEGKARKMPARHAGAIILADPER